MLMRRVTWGLGRRIRSWPWRGARERSLAAVRWSRGLRAVMLGPATDPSVPDEELAAKNVSGNLFAVIQFPVWSCIRTVGLEHALLVAAENGGLAAANALIRQGRLRPDARTAAKVGRDPLGAYRTRQPGRMRHKLTA
jgi:hypothetical protein